MGVRREEVKEARFVFLDCDRVFFMVALVYFFVIVLRLRVIVLE